MKITLISPYPDITAFGVRSISAFLKKNGMDTRLVFLPDPLGDDLKEGVPRYTKKVLEQTASLCEGSDLVGISLMTNYFDTARQITEFLREKTAAKILWGGVHPTIRPYECIRFADYVCVGDGEEAILDLARALEQKEDTRGIPNIWAMIKDAVYENPPRPLTGDLSGFPLPDYNLDDDYILENATQSVEKMDSEKLKAHLAKGSVSAHLNLIGYQTMTGRGCPHQCAYCINDAVKRLYGPKGYLRWRSVTHVMDELSSVIGKYPFIEFIWISDDAFFSRTKADIAEFCKEYKKRINLPFSCLASPLTMQEEKMNMLVDAGLIYLQMGVQSGSARIQKLFNRERMGNSKMLSAMRVINQFQDRLHPPSYDFILDTPWETQQDKVESIRLIARIPKPFRLQPFSLVLYPGTILHDKAKQEGLLTNEAKEIYTKSYTMRAPTYLNLLITMAKNGRFPSKLLQFLVSDKVVRVLGSDTAKPFIKMAFLGLRSAFQTVRRLLGKA